MAYSYLNLITIRPIDLAADDRHWPHAFLGSLIVFTATEQTGSKLKWPQELSASALIALKALGGKILSPSKESGLKSTSGSKAGLVQMVYFRNRALFDEKSRRYWRYIG